jgi:hypothetical protein
MKFDKKHVVFTIVCILLIVSVIYRVQNPFEQKRVDRLTFTGTNTDPRQARKGPATNEKENQDVKSSQDLVSRFLNKAQFLDTHGFSDKAGKDLFARYRLPQKRAKKKILVPDKKKTQQENLADVIKKDPVQEVRQYLTSYSVYGSYTGGGRTSVFLAKNKQVLVAGIGDRIDGKYLIEDIQENSIRIRAIDLNETIQLDMREFNNE